MRPRSPLLCTTSSLFGSQMLTSPCDTLSPSCCTQIGVSVLPAEVLASSIPAPSALLDSPPGMSTTKRRQYQCRLKTLGTSSMGMPLVSGKRKYTNRVPATVKMPKNRKMPHCTQTPLLRHVVSTLLTMHRCAGKAHEAIVNACIISLASHAA